MNGTNGDGFSELAPLFALGALDADERSAFQDHVPGCAVCQAELRAYMRVVDQLPLAADVHQPPNRVRDAVMASVAPTPTSLTAPARIAVGSTWKVLLPLAAALLLGIGYWRAASEARSERARAEEFSARLAASEQRLAEMQVREVALRSLLANPDAHVVSLAGQKDAAVARARVFWNPNTTEAIVTVAGLPAPPSGKAYQMWVIAGGAPVPAGVFSVAADGSAVFTLPRVSATSEVKTFAVTMEPAAGVPAPTGPMVLAGQVT